ncbi:MAG: VPLPA-CTERM sorting domain-containing protein [Gammaproteobacteria bacterium]|nr:VPLPA-CTERM sorting domain-containing protein [Gammaproteobacteria bacterium]
MSKQTLIKSVIAAGTLLVAGQGQAATVAITEWMYSGNGGEFIEFTNISGSAVDFSGWSYDDDSRLPGEFDLSGFGLVAAGESVIITENSAAQFISDWSLSASIKVLGSYTNNLGRNDEINLFDNGGDLVDQLTYGDQTFSGTIRTQNASGNPLTPAALGANDPAFWTLSEVGDQYGSYLSVNGDIGNPGTIGALNPVPVPAAVWLLGSALVGLVGVGRRKS